VFAHSGFAWHYKLESDARKAERGSRANSETVAAWEWRKKN